MFAVHCFYALFEGSFHLHIQCTSLTVWRWDWGNTMCIRSVYRSLSHSKLISWHRMQFKTYNRDLTMALTHLAHTWFNSMVSSVASAKVSLVTFPFLNPLTDTFTSAKGWFPVSLNFYVRTCVKFTFGNKIEAMHETWFANIKVEPRSTSRLSSVLFILPLFYLRD